MNKIFVIFLTSISFFLSYFSRLAWSIVSVYSSLNPTAVEDGIIFSLFFVGYILVQIPAGIIADKKPKEVIILALIGLSISSFISGFSVVIQEEYFASILMGLSAGWIYPITIKILSSSFNTRELPVAIGYYSLAWPLSIVLAGLILPFLSINLGWRFSYYLISIISIIVAILYFRLKITVVSNSKKFQFISDKNVFIVSSAGFLFFLAYWIITLYAYKYFLYIGLNDYIAGLAYSLLAFAGIPSTIIAGYIIRKIGVKNTLSFFEGIYGILTILFSFSISTLGIMIISFFMGFIRFIITPANSSAVSMIGKNNAGSVSGFANLFWQSSGILAPIIASFIIISLNYFILWILAGIIIIVSSIVYALLLRIT
ncbi:MFS transporter [Acidianus sulfidivorans JP7]|uniref:MFS transporter n=1 Tax=Acidianus sulfidivorans JP7 TaxID=619593 RepID=A0A2U9IN75_9CREN|nr:MFS transporter [Acidianus sulfidivorans]AWR97455.1 MFS transporter [Acidianus sulfidivorans JP7]